MIRDERDVTLVRNDKGDIVRIRGPKGTPRGRARARLLLDANGRFVGLEFDAGTGRVAWMLGQHEEVEQVKEVDVEFETTSGGTFAVLKGSD